MDKFIGFDIDHKNTVACITQAGQRDRYTKLKTEVGVSTTIGSGHTARWDIAHRHRNPSLSQHWPDMKTLGALPPNPRLFLLRRVRSRR